MKILLTADCVGGVWTYALDLIRSLPQHRFVVATMGELPTQQQRDNFLQLHNAVLCTSSWKLEWMEKPWDDVQAAGDWLLDLERQFSPDIVHLNGYTHAALNFRAPKIVVAHSCVLSWWRAVKGEDAPPEWNCYRSKVAEGLKHAAIVVAPTHALLQEMHLIYGEFSPTQVIYNGSAPLPNEAEAMTEPPFVLSAGRLWDEAKNVALLDKVAPLINAPIRVAGETGDGEFAAQNLERLGFLPALEMSEQMHRAAIWAHPARYEPFGLAVLEAANRGCALVLSDIPTLRELWQDAAVFVAPDDAAQWANAITRLLDSPLERDEWAAKARERAQSYNLNRFGAAYEQLYEQLLSHS